jgi:hypothetical protein
MVSKIKAGWPREEPHRHDAVLTLVHPKSFFLLPEPEKDRAVPGH